MSVPFSAIFVLGPQGSGKGTQAKILAETLGYLFWDTGAILRQNKDFITPSGERAGDILKSGRLFTDEELFSVVKKEIKKLPRDRGIVFDGIPRRVGQAKTLLSFLSEQERKELATIVLVVPEEESIKRLLLRAGQEKREDDTREGIQKRLQEYHENTVPMFDFMKTQTKFLEVDGTPSIEEVKKEVFSALGISEE